MKSEFQLNPDIAFLNHGSFGACPRPVFEAYQRYQRELEREPVDFLQRTFEARMLSARTTLAAFLNCDPDHLAFVRNATYGMNLIARSLPLGPGDTVLSTDQDYGAVDRMWQMICAETGAKLVRALVPVPAASPEAIVESIAGQMDSSVRVVSFSHISSESAQQFPIEALLKLAADAGAISVVDGAHAPGQLQLNLSALGADFYVGNCHKWLLSPKSAAFVCVGAQWVDRIRPPVISWGKIPEGASALLLENEWQGTTDISAVLAVADAIKFLEQHDWLGTVVPQCSRLLDDWTAPLLEATGQKSIYPSPGLRPPQLATFRLPKDDHSSLHSTLFHEHQIEVPVAVTPHGSSFRVSVQAYNNASDLERLVKALTKIL